MDPGLGMERIDQLAQLRGARVERDGGGRYDEAVIDIWLLGPEHEWSAWCDASVGRRAGGGNASVVDGEVGVCV